MVAECADLQSREIGDQTFGLLQAHHVGLRVLEKREQMRQSRLDRIDVPGRDFHGRGGTAAQPIENELPQPQDEAAFGLRIWNEAPIRSSTKSTSAPLNRPSETSSMTTPTPSCSNTKSSSLRWSSNDSPY